MSSLAHLTIRELSDGFDAKKFSATEVTQATLEQMRAHNAPLNAYVLTMEEEALSMAAEADVRIATGRRLSVLDGVPCGLKDIFSTKGARTTACSKILANFVPPYDATTVSMLRDAGSVFLGKTNLDEFACGGSSEHSCFGVTKNPWNLEKVAGGSSGGSAAAVAADMAAFTLGTDTGGSIRLPASLCSVVGLKVTYGRVSRSGVIAMASSLDTIGAFSKTVEDSAMVLQQIAGHDERDSTTPLVEVPDYTKNLAKGVKGLRIGLPKEYFTDGVDPEVQKILMDAADVYRKMGAQVSEMSLPMTKYGVAIYYIIMPAELSTNLARFDGIRYGSIPKDIGESLQDMYYHVRGGGFGDEIKRRIMIGTYVLSAGYFDAFYSKAQKVRTLIRQDFDNAFQNFDVLLTPVSPFPAWGIGEKANDPLAMYLADALTIPSSMAGIPGLSVPCGFTKSGLPVGMQLLGSQFAEPLLFQVASAYEQQTSWRNSKPKL
ncbi:MAG: Asp-tRNA(Asn)/Glu-tRNA(Gln) amidotransferase subunit GatA [Patescibacteria group bacterium]